MSDREPLDAGSNPATSQSVEEARERLKSVMYPSSQDVGQAKAALDAFEAAIRADERAVPAPQLDGDVFTAVTLVNYGRGCLECGYAHLGVPSDGTVSLDPNGYPDHAPRWESEAAVPAPAAPQQAQEGEG